MANPKQFIPMLQKFEGGWSNHPADRGGATMCGITYKTFSAWRKRKKQPEPSLDDLRNISQEEWADIFISLYWNKWKANLINNQSIANILVDFAWGSGPITAIRYIQKHVLNVSADGICGPITLNAINQFPNQQLLFDMIKAARLAFVDQLVERNPTQKVFLRGWRNRINAFKFEPTLQA